MSVGDSQYDSKEREISLVHQLYNFLARRAYTAIMLGALFCTLMAKYFHSWRMNYVNEYLGWVLADISVLLGIEIILAIICFRWRRRWIIRTATIIAAVVCTWSVMNAGWLIRTGTQILPTVILPLIRAPINSFGIIGVSLIKMPTAAVILLGPSAIALAFFFSVLAKPQLQKLNSKIFFVRIVISIIVVFISVGIRDTVIKRGSAHMASAGLRYNCQLMAVSSFLLPESGWLTKEDLAKANREIPTFEKVELKRLAKVQKNYNLVIVVLEGIQYRYTSLYDKQNNLTPYLATLAQQGVEFSSTRATVTHTTKALFSLLTGRLPSVSQDIAEAVPVSKPYASLATILKQHLNYRTAFFQSAKGNFECRPGLVYNLGFDKFWARDDLGDPNVFIGSLGSDEFSMLKPITDWIKADSTPFLLTVLCSITHDPYEVPKWFAEPAKGPIERYRQAIFYTDKFLATLNAELASLGLSGKTIFCVIGDHGEAFGEHGLLGHERIGFEEVLNIPWVMRAPSIKPGSRVTNAVSSVDLTPTLLALLGFEMKTAGIDGIDALGPLPNDRKVYFSGWTQQSPAGFIEANRKFIYDPTTEIVSVYDMEADPLELFRIELPQEQADEVASEIVNWRKKSIFKLNQTRTGRTKLFGRWFCRWTNRVSSANYKP